MTSSTITTDKPLTSGEYWDQFGRGTLRAAERPTPREAADFVLGLMRQIREKEEEVQRVRKENKIACQQFETFALEIQNLAHKRRPMEAI